MAVHVQGSESAARRRVPTDMAPPWKVSHGPNNAQVTWPRIHKDLALMSKHQMIVQLLSTYKSRLADGSMQQHLLYVHIDNHMYVSKYIITYIV